MQSLARHVNEEDEEENLSPALKIGVPVLLCGIFMLFAYLVIPFTEFTALLGMMVAYVVPPAGRETVIPLSILIGIPWWLIASTLALLDFAGALFMAWNFPLVLRIPIAGPWIARFMTGGKHYLNQHPWLEKLYFIGLVLFVCLPIEGSGSIVGTIIGRMLGMTKMQVLTCITLGGVIGSFALALGVDYIWVLLGQDAGIGSVLIALILAGTGVLVLLRSVVLKRNMQKAEQTADN